MPGDSEAHWLNWLFYQQSPLFQIPFFQNYAYGEELSLTITLNDSIPLMAFIFKAFQNYIPFESQYFGIWVFVCFFCQSLFSIKLLSRFSSDDVLILLFSIFFVLSPVFLWRLWGHYSLMAHWLILAAFYIYFSSRFNFFNWLILLLISYLSSGYISLMVCLLFTTDVLRRKTNKELSFGQLIIFFSSFFVISLIFLYLIGYFYEGVKLSTSGFGIYKANLLAFFDGDSFWSLTFPDIYSHEFEHEGFGFLGSGTILLTVVIFVVSLVKKESITIFSDNKQKYLVVIALALFLYALSNNIHFGYFKLVSIPLPDFMEKLFGIVRASGRMIWIPFYLIYLIIFINISKSKYSTFYRIVLCCLIIFQLFDMQKASVLFRNKTGDIDKNYASVYSEHYDGQYEYWKNNLWNSPMKSPEWGLIGKEYKRIVYIYTTNRPKRYFPLALFAARNNMSINFGSFSRVKGHTRKMLNKRNKEELASKSFRDDTLYYFDDDDEWLKILKSKRKFDLLKEVDGFKILAPNYYKRGQN